MKKVKLLLINVIIVSATSLIIRTVGISFQVYISNKIGPMGIGLFQLITSIYSFAITFSISGVRLATTRLVAEELGKNKRSQAKKALRICFTYASGFGITASVILFFSAGFIGKNLLNDLRTVSSLKILAFSLPLIAISSVLSGYFTAVRRVAKTAVVQIFEQLISIGVTIACFTVFSPNSIEGACIAIVIGSCAGELTSFLFLLLLFYFDVRRYQEIKRSSKLLSRMIKIAMPVALGAYISSGMRTVQQLLIPYGFKKSGASSESALSAYGTVNGMAMPVIMYPSVLFYTLSDLIVPELAECKVQGKTDRINSITTKLFNLGMIASLCIMSVFLFYSGELSSVIYNNNSTAYLMRILSPLVPLMYLDTLVDGVLKGIGEQVRTMYYNSFESFISVILIYFLLPRYALNGYIFTIIFARALNFSLSCNRLIKVTDFRISIKNILKSVFSIIGSFNITCLISYFIKNMICSKVSALLIHITLFTLFYFLILIIISDYKKLNKKSLFSINT
ncbi:MAG: oligosaccharide flippase family protein [Bacillota bacterium]|nr:oligosaccharide flippase family protein [Bacillota bacterium]